MEQRGPNQLINPLNLSQEEFAQKRAEALAQANTSTPHLVDVGGGVMMDASHVNHEEMGQIGEDGEKRLDEGRNA